MASQLYSYFLMRWQNQTIYVNQLEQAYLSKGYITRDEFIAIIKSPTYVSITSTNIDQLYQLIGKGYITQEEYETIISQ